MPLHPLCLQGKLLLADPSLRDGTFDRSVILLTHHTPEEGAHGIILNHPTGKVVGELLPSDEFSPLRHMAVHAGGPVSCDQLTFSSFWWSPKGGLRWALRISKDEAISHAKQPNRIVRAFIGYAGWSAGQLEAEIQRQAWHTIEARSGLLGNPHDELLWSRLLGSISPFHRILSDAPRDPSLN
jgi:putative transcriptional regulator